MKIVVEIPEAAERLEELIELAERGDEIIICRDEKPIATLVALARENGDPWDDLWALTEGSRPANFKELTSNHDEFYDEHGLPK